MKASSLVFRALFAAEELVSAEVMALIDARDLSAQQWADAGYPRGPYAALDEANAAIDREPLASALMKILKARTAA